MWQDQPNYEKSATYSPENMLFIYLPSRTLNIFYHLQHHTISAYAL